MRGLELAIDKDRSFLQIDDERKRRWLQEQALRIAGSKFAEFTESEQKRAYGIIGHFLSNDFNDDLPLRKLADQAIKQGSFLSASIRARAFIICEQWQQVVPLGEPAISHLEEVIEKQLMLTTSESDIFNQQIKAVETISQISFADFSEKIKKLVKVLLGPGEELRKATARLLKIYTRVAPNIANLIESLLFEYSLDKPELKNLTVPEMNERISSCREKKYFIDTLFSKAIDEANYQARIYSQSTSAAQEFLQNKQNAYLSDIRRWITDLEKQIAATSTQENKIKYHQSILRNALSKIRGIDFKLHDELMALPEQAALNTREYQTYSQCQTLSYQLENLKSQFLRRINQVQPKLNQKSKDSFKDGLQQMLWGVAIIYIMENIIMTLVFGVGWFARIIYGFGWLCVAGAIIYFFESAALPLAAKRLGRLSQEISENWKNWK